MKKINKYVFTYNDENYIVSYVSVLGDKYDYKGQMSDYPEATEGWCRFESGKIIIDETKKAEIIAEREKEKEKPTWEERAEAQYVYTAMMTGTLLDE